MRQCYATTHNGKTENSLRVNWMGFLLAFLTCVAAGCSPKSERASVEDLYTTRMLGLSYLHRNQLPEAEAEFKKLTSLAPDDPARLREPRAHLSASRPLR